MALAGALARYVPEFARLAWRTSSAATAQALETDLTRKGFAVALDRSHGRVVAQKRMVANDIHFAMKWGAQYSVGRADWLGAETVYTEDRALDDHWA
jgi:hypothetical protein